jgi:hypothetical protein
MDVKPTGWPVSMELSPEQAVDKSQPAPPLLSPPQRSGRRLRNEAIFSQGVETGSTSELPQSSFLNTLLSFAREHEHEHEHEYEQEKCSLTSS